MRIINFQPFLKLKNIIQRSSIVSFSLLTTRKSTTNIKSLDKKEIFTYFGRNTQRNLKIKDNVSENYYLIYRNTMSNYIYTVHLLTTFTAGIVLFVIYLNDSNYIPKETKSFEVWSDTSRKTNNEIVIFIASFCLLLVILQVFITQLPIRIYKLHDKSEYLMIFYSKWLIGNNRLTCKVGQVSQLPKSGVLPWKHNRFLISKDHESYKVIMLDNYFRRPGDLSVMLGQQKDYDLDNEINDKSNI